MVNSVIRKKHYVGIRNAPHIWDLTYDGAKEERMLKNGKIKITKDDMINQVLLEK